MRIAHVLLLTLGLIPDHIDASSQSAPSPEDDPVTGTPSVRSPTPGRNPPLDIDLNQLPADSPTRERSRSPPNSDRSSPLTHRSTTTSIRLSPPDRRGCGIENLRSIRLISYGNAHRVFELRTYSFPADEELKLKAGNNAYASVPTGEQIVLSTSDGDIFAIWRSYDILVYIYNNYYHSGRHQLRVKVNMRSHKVTPLTKDEVDEIPAGINRRISNNYRIHIVNPELNHHHLHCFFRK